MSTRLERRLTQLLEVSRRNKATISSIKIFFNFYKTKGGQEKKSDYGLSHGSAGKSTYILKII